MYSYDGSIHNDLIFTKDTFHFHQFVFTVCIIHYVAVNFKNKEKNKKENEMKTREKWKFHLRTNCIMACLFQFHLKNGWDNEWNERVFASIEVEMEIYDTRFSYSQFPNE